MKKQSRSENETLQIGKEFASGLAGGDIVLLSGSMGAGKTVFVKGIAKGLGIESVIVSPTFTIANEYKSGNGFYLYHIDAYRLKDETEAEAAGLLEYIGARDRIAVIEWHENITGVFRGLHCRHVTVAGEGDALREITIHDVNK